MDATTTQIILNWSLLLILLLWMIVFAVLAFRSGRDGKIGAENQILDSEADIANFEAQARVTAPRLAAVQNEARRYRPHNTGEVEAVTM